MTSSNEQLVPVEQIDYANAIHTMRSVSADIALFAACVAVGEKHNPNWSGIKAKAEEWVFDLRTALRTPPAQHPGWTERGKQWLADGAPVEQLKPARKALEWCVDLLEERPSEVEWDALMAWQHNRDLAVAAAREAIAACNTGTPPAVEPDEGLVRDIRNQIHAIMAGLVDTVGLIDKNPPGPFAVSKDINESVQALQQVSLKLALFTPSIRAQALEEAAKVADSFADMNAGSGEPQIYSAMLSATAVAEAIRAIKGGQGV